MTSGESVGDGTVAEGEAAGSVEVMCTTSEQEDAMFQLASQALTVRSKGVPSDCGSGVPILPVRVPGALVSPGSNTCSCEATGLNMRK